MALTLAARRAAHVQRQHAAGTLFRASAARLGGGGGLKPGWAIPNEEYHKYTYQPTIPDKHYNVAHYNYAPITMWLRARRPSMERVLYAMYDTAYGYWDFLARGVGGALHDHMPGFGYKLFGLVGFFVGYNWIFGSYTADSEAYFTLEKIKTFGVTHKLWAEGFFKSHSEDLSERKQDFDMDAVALQKEFDAALAEATQKRDFGVLCEKLDPSQCSGTWEVKDPISWRFNMMPFSPNGEDTHAFPVNAAEKPVNGFFLDVGSSGYYNERQDNKPNPIRKARHYWTSSYSPPTK